MTEDEDEMTEAAHNEDANWLIGRRVSMWREARGLTQEQLADLAKPHGFTGGQGYLSYLERGYRKWTAASLRAISKALGVRMADLMPDADGPPPDAAPTLTATPAEVAFLMVWRTQGLRAAGRYLLGLLKE